MNAVHWHLMLNHFPIVGIIISTALLLWGIGAKQNNIKAIASVLTVVFAIIAIVVFKTGEPAEEAVEKLPGVTEAAIELHEEAAELAMWAIAVSGIAAFISLVLHFTQRPQAVLLYILTALLGLFSTFALVRTGYYGGQIRHTEIASAATSPAGNQATSAETTEEDDD